jgi:hypothetical protein
LVFDGSREEDKIHKHRSMCNSPQMRVYLNTNIYGRLFDDLTQDRILKESIASTKILRLAFLRLIPIMTSDVLLTEISLIEDCSKRELVEAIVTYLPEDIVEIEN